MKETLYHQIREFGIPIRNEPKLETWMVNGCYITVYFKDPEHTKLDVIIL